MTDCNNGKWHGWNGGQCPVHTKSIVEVVLRMDKGGSTHISKDRAGELNWLGYDQASIIAFRVTKVHREPREFWVMGGNLFFTEAQALEAAKERRQQSHHLLPLSCEIFRVVEALDE